MVRKHDVNGALPSDGKNIQMGGGGGVNVCMSMWDLLRLNSCREKRVKMHGSPVDFLWGHVGNNA